MSRQEVADTLSPTAIVQNRVDTIKEYLCLKYKRSQILEKIANDHRDWKVRTGTIDRYIRISRLQMLEDGRKSHLNLKGEAAADLRFIYKKALEEDDLAVALRTRIELNKLYQLHGPATTPDGPEMEGEKDVTPRK